MPPIFLDAMEMWERSHGQKTAKISNDLENYRPISLLPLLGKTAETIIVRYINKEVKELDIFPDTQFGFRPGHDTTLQIL